MNRYVAKADANQKDIVAALRGIGARVVPTHTVGQGFPDLVVSFGGRTFLIEVKDPTQPKHRHELTPAQKEFHAAWTGEIYVVFTVEQAIAVAKDGAPGLPRIERDGDWWEEAPPKLVQQPPTTSPMQPEEPGESPGFFASCVTGIFG